MNQMLACLTLAFGALAVAPVLASEPDGPAACPTSPTRVVRSAGGVTEYTGTFKGIPELCAMQRPDGAGYFYYGAWRSDWPGAGDAYPALRTVLSGPAGTRASFTTHSVPGMQWVDTLANEGTGTLVVDGQPHVVLQLAHERTGFDGNTYHSIITSWRDVRTGVTLKTTEHQISGQSYGPAATWTAVAVEPIGSPSK